MRHGICWGVGDGEMDKERRFQARCNEGRSRGELIPLEISCISGFYSFRTHESADIRKTGPKIQRPVLYCCDGSRGLYRACLVMVRRAPCDRSIQWRVPSRVFLFHFAVVASPRNYFMMAKMLTFELVLCDGSEQ